jgi:hypothetical protein
MKMDTHINSFPSPFRDCLASPFMVRQAHHERTAAHEKPVTQSFALSPSKGEWPMTTQSLTSEGKGKFGV